MTSKDKKQQRKRADLEMLSTLLNIGDRFSPKQKEGEALQHEQLLAAMQSRQENQQMSPLRMREAQSHVSGLEDQQRFTQQLQPLQLADLGSQTKARDLGAQFEQSSMKDRLAALAAQAQSAQLQAKGQEATLPYLGDSAFLDNALKKNQSMMAPLQRESLGLENDYRKQMIQQEGELFPLKKQASTVNMGETLTNLQMMNKAPWDIPAFLQQGGVNIPQAIDATPQGAEAQKIDAQFQQGLMPSMGSPEGQRWFGQNVPPLMQQMQVNPHYAWSQPAQALAELQNHPGAYGHTTIDFSRLNPQMYQQALQAIRAQQNQNR